MGRLPPIGSGIWGTQLSYRAVSCSGKPVHTLSQFLARNCVGRAKLRKLEVVKVEPMALADFQDGTGRSIGVIDTEAKRRTIGADRSAKASRTRRPSCSNSAQLPHRTIGWRSPG